MNLRMSEFNKCSYWWGFPRWKASDFNSPVGGDIITPKVVNDLVTDSHCSKILMLYKECIYNIYYVTSNMFT